MIFKYASTLILLLPSLALNSRIRDPSTLCLLEALKYSARDNFFNYKSTIIIILVIDYITYIVSIFRKSNLTNLWLFGY